MDATSSEKFKRSLDGLTSHQLFLRLAECERQIGEVKEQQRVAGTAYLVSLQGSHVPADNDEDDGTSDGEGDSDIEGDDDNGIQQHTRGERPTKKIKPLDPSHDRGDMLKRKKTKEQQKAYRMRKCGEAALVNVPAELRWSNRVKRRVDYEESSYESLPRRSPDSDEIESIKSQIMEGSVKRTGGTPKGKEDDGDQESVGDTAQKRDYGKEYYFRSKEFVEAHKTEIRNIFLEQQRHAPSDPGYLVGEFINGKWTVPSSEVQMLNPGITGSRRSHSQSFSIRFKNITITRLTLGAPFIETSFHDPRDASEVIGKLYELYDRCKSSLSKPSPES